jgi:hypothetical protein
MGNTIEVVLTILAMSFWILFPIGMFMSVSHVDKNTDQIIHLNHPRHESLDDPDFKQDRYSQPVFVKQRFDWHHPILYFRRWLHQ